MEPTSIIVTTDQLDRWKRDTAKGSALAMLYAEPVNTLDGWRWRAWIG